MPGTCSPRFSAVQDAFAANFAAGDVGASVCVIHDGEIVVDLWDGVADDLNGVSKPWEQDTLINVWSITKSMMYLCVYTLVGRGEIDFDAPMSRYWPEFAANGKASVLVRHCMSHTSGLPGFGEPLSADDLCDWPIPVGILERQAAWWEPGTASGYQAITQGYLLGELVRRVTGKTLGQFFADEFAKPLGLDFHIGTGAEHDNRVRRVIPPTSGLTEGAAEDSVAHRALSNPLLDAAFSWTEQWRRCESPAANGHGNARSVAQAQQIMAGLGSLGGRQWFPEAIARRAYEVQSVGIDQALLRDITVGIGYGHVSDALPLAPSRTALWWGGWGGSIVVADPEQKLTVAYVMNQMSDGTTGDMRAALLTYAAYGALG